MKAISWTLALAGLLAGCQTGPSGSHSAASGGQTATLYVQGMSCPLCAANIDKELLRVEGVERVSVDLGTGKVLARLSDNNPPTRDRLAAAIQNSGFTLDRIEMPGAQGSAP